MVTAMIVKGCDQDYDDFVAEFHSVFCNFFFSQFSNFIAHFSNF
jgi:hypothetical protein